MENIKVSDVITAINGVPFNISSFNSFVNAVAIHSRKIEKKFGLFPIFFALKGERVDGHNFVSEAIKEGAILAIVCKDFDKNLPIIKVEDTLVALHKLATYYRKKFNIDVIGVTGSNGKTTAKEMIAECLSIKYNVYKNEGSMNSLTGLPLSIFGIENKHEIAVLEMGINKIGEMEKLCSISLPTIGVITNISKTHIEGLGSIKCVFNEKTKLLNFVKKAILNGDDVMLRKINYNSPIFYGIRNGEINAKILKTNNLLCNEFLLNGVKFSLQLFGKHNIYNALAGISVGLYFGIELNDIAKRFEKIKPLPHRDKIIDIMGAKIIDSSYNANPQSMKIMLNEVSKIKGRKIFVLGDMLELGKESYKLHKYVSKFIDCDILICYGELSKFYLCESKAKEKYFVNSIENVVDILRKVIKPADVVLIKGSRAMCMEKIIEYLR